MTNRTTIHPARRTWRLRSAVLGLAVALSSASAFADVPDAGDPDAGTSEMVLEQPMLPELPEVDGGITPISLDEAIRRALVQNPQIGTAVDEYKRAEALVTEARAGWFPILNGNAVYTRLDNDRLEVTGVGTTVLAAKNQLSLFAGLTVPVFAPKAWLNWDVTRESVQASADSAGDARRLVTVGVGRAYLTVLALHRLLEADLRAVADAQAHRDYARLRFQGGVGNRVDVVRADQTLETGEALVEGARSALARAQESLGVLVATNRPLDVTGDPKLPVPPNPAEATQDVKDRRLDLAALNVRTEVADHVVRNDWSDFMPVIALAFQPFFQDPSTPTLPTTGWQATAALTWPLYDGGLRYGQQRERALLANEARLNQEGAERQAYSDVRAAFAEVEHADAGLLSARRAAKLAHEALDLVNTSYRAGASTNIEVIDAQRAALDADTQSAVAEDSARQARLDLLSATGRFP